MEHHKAELYEVEPHDAREDDSARFLHELRQLRAEAGLQHAELAARAHYPCDVIRAAEAGPSLPSLPVLSAYVQACGGVTLEWEERWRSLKRSPASSLLPVRSAGESDAATAGARVGSATAAGEGHDPGFIMAALSRVADGMATESPASASAASAVPGSAVPSATSPASADLTAKQADHLVPSADARDTAMPALTAAAVGAPQPRRPSDGSSVPATGRVSGSRRLQLPRAVIAALVAVALCLVAAALALFA